MRVVAFLFLTLAFAGCLNAEPAPDTDVGSEPDATRTFESIAEALPNITAMWDVAEDVDWWEAFVDQNKRDAYVPDTPVTHSGASRQAIEDRLTGMGLEVTTHMYPAGAFGVTAPGGPAQAAAVVAHIPGTSDRTIAFIAHYDTQAGTIEGAYDNGSGTAAVISICGILSQLNLTHSIDCILFDAEEVGAVASGAYVNANPDLPYDLVMGFDMIGLNCPGYEWKMYQWVGANVAEWLFPIVERVTHNVTGLDHDCAEVFDFNDRNSDESRFASAGYPTVRFAGGRTAGAYDQYHMPDDTPEHIYELTGGRANWELGYARVVESAAILALMVDPFTLEEMQAGI